MGMGIQAIESVNSEHVTQQSLGVKSLKERLADVQPPASDNAAANAEFFKHLLEKNPQTSKEVLDLLIGMFSSTDGGPHFTKMSDLSAALAYSQNELKNVEGRPPELGEAIIGANAQLFSLNGYIDEMRKRIFFPTEENGGLATPW